MLYVGFHPKERSLVPSKSAFVAVENPSDSTGPGRLNTTLRFAVDAIVSARLRNVMSPDLSATLYASPLCPFNKIVSNPATESETYW